MVPYTLISVRLQGIVIYFTTWGLFVIYFTSHIYRYIPKPDLHVWTFFKIDPQTKGYQGFVVLATLRRAIREGEQARGEGQGKVLNISWGILNTGYLIFLLCRPCKNWINVKNSCISIFVVLYLYYENEKTVIICNYIR